MNITYPITPGEDSVAMALITATLQSAAQYVSVRHQIPINNVLAGMSVSANLLPPVNMALQAFQEKQQAALVAASTPPVPAPAPAPRPPRQAPVIPPPESPPVPVIEAPPPTNPAAYAVFAAKAISQERPAAIPSALTDLPKPAPEPEPAPVSDEFVPAPVAKKKSPGRPRKVV
jgi:hypothetical protein